MGSVLSMGLFAVGKGHKEIQPITLAERLGITQGCHQLLERIGHLGTFIEVIKVRPWFWDDCPNEFDVEVVMNPFGLVKIEIAWTMPFAHRAAIRDEINRERPEEIAQLFVDGLTDLIRQKLFSCCKRTEETVERLARFTQAISS